jgi:hypothetical protein
MSVLKRSIFALGLAFTATAAAAGENPKLTNLYVIPVRAGMNTVTDFTLDGDRAIIARAWRDNGNAPGFNVFTVTMPERAPAEGPPRRNWDFVSFFDGDKESLAITDRPHDQELYVRSIRFAKGKLNDRTETLALIAEKEAGSAKSLTEAAPVSVQVFALRSRGEETPVGRPDHYFERITTLKSQRRYCNAETALTVELNLPMPRGWPGNKVPDGCP